MAKGRVTTMPPCSRGSMNWLDLPSYWLLLRVQLACRQANVRWEGSDAEPFATFWQISCYLLADFDKNLNRNVAPWDTGRSSLPLLAESGLNLA